MKANRRVGRPSKLSEEQEKKLVKEYLAGDLTIRKLAAKYEITLPTMYRIVKKAGVEVGS